MLPRDDHYASAEMRDVAQALDLDQLALKDLFSDDHRAKFEAVGQARLVITNAVALNPDTITLEVHPVSIVVTDRALICLLAPNPDFHARRDARPAGTGAGPGRGGAGTAAASWAR